MVNPKTCFDCKLCDKTNLAKPVAQQECIEGIPIVECTRKGNNAIITVPLAQTQAVCLEDTQPILPEHTHCQDITPKGEL